MNEHSEMIISHFTSIGHGNESTLGDRLRKSIQGAKEFLIPNGEINRSRAGLLFIESYRNLPLLSWPRTLVDSFVEVEESILLFRNSHARMVERMIGRRMGTGGSSGVDYLDATLKYRIFVDLWTVRTILVKTELLPGVVNPEYYGFNSQS
jgi:tryptophan 2,3-dioxygenase